MNISVHSHTLKSLLKGFRKALVFFAAILVVLSIVLGGLVYLQSHRTVASTTFNSTSKVMLAPDENKDSVDGTAMQVFVNTEKEIIGSEKFTKFLNKNMEKDIDIKPERLLNYEVDNPNGTSVIELKVTALSKKDAEKISKYMAKTIATDKLNILQGGKAKVIDSHSEVTENLTRSNKMLYVYSVLIAAVLSFIITLIKVYYDPRIYDNKIISDAFTTGNVYLVKNDQNYVTALKKIFKTTELVEKTKNLDLTITYFEGKDKYINDTLDLANNIGLKVPISIFSDTDEMNVNGEVTNYSTNNLYSFNTENVSGISFIDNTKSINAKDSMVQVLVVEEGKTTKNQVVDTYNEIKQFNTSHLFVIYFG